jgi:hypothetical protein
MGVTKRLLEAQEASVCGAQAPISHLMGTGGTR